DVERTSCEPPACSHQALRRCPARTTPASEPCRPVGPPTVRGGGAAPRLPRVPSQDRRCWPRRPASSPRSWCHPRLTGSLSSTDVDRSAGVTAPTAPFDHYDLSD